MFKQSRNLLIAAAVVAALGGATALATAKPSQEVIEARQETQIWTTYALSPYLRANDLAVAVHEGKATLSGKVGEDVDKDLAKQIALGVDGLGEAARRSRGQIVQVQIPVERDRRIPSVVRAFTA